MQDNLGTSTDFIIASGNKKKQTQCSERIPSRFVFTFVCFAGVCLAYGLRVNLNLAIVAMVNSTHSEPNGTLAVGQDECPGEKVNITSTGTSLSNQGTFQWSQKSQGNILGAFYYGYTSTQFIGGRMAELVSAKWLFFAGIFGSSVFSLLTPLCARLSEVAIVIVRVFNGLLQGMIYPSMFVLVAKWIPTTERSTVLGICLSGSSVGTIIAMPLTGYLCEYGFDGGWPSTFYVCGSAGLFYCILYVFLVFDTPLVHPRISDRELTYICGIQTPEIRKPKKLQSRSVPWKALLTSMPLWAINVSRFASGYGFHIVLTRMPAYLDYVLHQSIQKNSFMNSIFHLACVVSMIVSGSLADFILRRGYMDKTKTRKIFELLSLLGMAVCMVGVPLVGCNSIAVTVLITAAMAAIGLSSGGSMPLAPELAPAFTGTVFGIMNTFGSVTGFIAPLVVGALLENHNGSRTQWSWVFYITSGVCCFGAVFFLIFGSGETQEWAKIEKELPEKTEKQERF